MRTIVFLVGLLALVALSAVRIADPSPLGDLREAYFDQLQRLAPRAFEPLPVRIVDVDEGSLAALGQWPWPRDVLARLVERLDELGAASVAFDVVFAEPDRLSPAAMLRDPRLAPVLMRLGEAAESLPDNDTTFAQAITGRPVVLGVAEALRQERSPSLPRKVGFVALGESPTSGFPAMSATTALVPVLAEAAAGIGSVNVSPAGTATIVRRVPIAWNSGDTILPSLALEALRVALGETTVLVGGSGTHAGTIDFVSVGGIEIPTTETGEVWVRWRWDEPSLYVPAAAVLAAGDDPDLRAAIEGHIVLIGTSAAGLLDIRASALGENIPGVSIHAQIIEQALLGDFLTRSDWVDGLELATFVALGLVVVVAMALAGPLVAFASAGAVAAMVGLGSWIAFREHGLLIDASFAFVGGTIVLLVATGVRYLFADREKQMVRRAFAHYVAPSVLAEIERAGHTLALGGEVREVTVLFGDVRGFTPLTKKLGAVRLVALLNGLFDLVSQAILEEEGTIDKFIGDAVMAFWNAPLPTPDHPVRSCRAALGMRRRLADFNRARASGAREESDGEPIALAVGIGTGEACVGNMGSQNRFNYSAIGDPVNRAARIETACRHVCYDVVACASTAERASGLALLDAGSLSLKGFAEPIETAIVVGDEALARSAAFRDLAERHARLRGAAGAGAEAFAAALAACRALALAVEPGLTGFYDAAARRRADFTDAPARHETSAVENRAIAS